MLALMGMSGWGNPSARARFYADAKRQKTRAF